MVKALFSTKWFAGFMGLVAGLAIVVGIASVAPASGAVSQAHATTYASVVVNLKGVNSGYLHTVKISKGKLVLGGPGIYAQKSGKKTSYKTVGKTKKFKLSKKCKFYTQYKKSTIMVKKVSKKSFTKYLKKVNKSYKSTATNYKLHKVAFKTSKGKVVRVDVI